MSWTPANNGEVFLKVVYSINVETIEHRESIACNSWVNQEYGREYCSYTISQVSFIEFRRT